MVMTIIKNWYKDDNDYDYTHYHHYHHHVYHCTDTDKKNDNFKNDKATVVGWVVGFCIFMMSCSYLYRYMPT